MHFFNYNLTIKIKTYKMEDVTSLILMLVGGYLIRFSLILSGQAWAKSYSQTVAFFILPIITYIITKTIYGNIALSLE